VAEESPFVAIAQAVAKEILQFPLHVKRGAPLLYEIKVNNNLQVMEPERIRKPTRGASAFQTDLCIFEERSPEILIPRVVIEFKTRITTHDVLTYSAKAIKHKQIYPYLRYGILVSGEKTYLVGSLPTTRVSTSLPQSLGSKDAPSKHFSPRS
jgi:hypothetical protein